MAEANICSNKHRRRRCLYNRSTILAAAFHFHHFNNGIFRPKTQFKNYKRKHAKKRLIEKKIPIEVTVQVYQILK